MEKRTMKDNILNRDNKGLGLVLVLGSLLVILSLVLFPYILNPFYLLSVLASTIVGMAGVFVFAVFTLMFATYYYLKADIKWFSKKRFIMLILAIYSVLSFISVVLISIDLNYSINETLSFTDYYITVSLNSVDGIFTNWKEAVPLDIRMMNIGFILPIFYWLTGGWYYGLLSLFILMFILLYALYVLIVNDYNILFSRLAFWSDDSKTLSTNTKAVGLDLNSPTEEFELNFDKQVEVTQERLDLVEKVRKNMDTKNYTELSQKIADEKQKLTDLRKKIIAKINANKEQQRQESNVSEGQRQEIMASLGYSNFSSVKSSVERTEQQVQAKEPFTYNKPETYVEEEKQEDNINLLNDGYKTAEESYNIEEQTLADVFAEDMLESFDPTQEVPLLENYAEIFENEKELLDDVKKTLETIIELEKEVEKHETGEIVIEGLDQEVTVEDYLTIPDTIAQTQEQEIRVEQEEAITEQINDDTTDSEFSSIHNDEEIEDALKIIEEEESNETSANWCTPYVLPSTSILTSTSTSFDNSVLVEEATDKAKKLNVTFESFGVKATVNSFEIGPTVTTFKVTLEPGIKTSKVTNLEDNLKLTLGAEYIRILAPIPGTTFIGIEVPNSAKRPVLFKTVYDETPSTDSGIVISIGQDVAGKSLSFDLTKAPHLLVAGSTGSGKSVAINTILASILLRYKPTDVQLVLVDPKMVEFAPFHGVPHLMAEVITDAANANNALKAMVEEMENRYRHMASTGTKKLEELNEKLLSEGKEKLPYIVVVIDELADLMMVAAKEVEDSIMRITQKARAAGIHMILATQRPSTEIITGTIKSNIPSRMAFTVASSIDSRTILGQVGAERLIGMGDMLVSLYGQLPFRGQGAYISNEEVEDIASFTKSQCDANYKIDVQSLIEMTNGAGGALIETNDPLYIAAKDTVIHYQKASTSMLQRHLNIGYNKAANIIETLEAEGVIGPAKGSKSREVLQA